MPQDEALLRGGNGISFSGASFYSAVALPECSNDVINIWHVKGNTFFSPSFFDGGKE